MTILRDATVAPTYRVTSVMPRRTPRLVHKPYAVFGVVQVLDVLLTGIILAVFVGAGREGNPIVATLFDHAGLTLGLGVILAVKLGATGILYWAQMPIKITTALYSLVIINNALILGLAAWSRFT